MCSWECPNFGNGRVCRKRQELGERCEAVDKEVGPVNGVVAGIQESISGL